MADLNQSNQVCSRWADRARNSPDVHAIDGVRHPHHGARPGVDGGVVHVGLVAAVVVVLLVVAVTQQIGPLARKEPQFVSAMWMPLWRYKKIEIY